MLVFRISDNIVKRKMPLIGYARVSTGDQNLSPQVDALKAAGCTRLFEEHASGAMRSRPQLAQAIAAVKQGDTLLVARIDRLARSLAHLLEIVETLRAKGAHFRSLGDPIDTTGPSGVLVPTLSTSLPMVLHTEKLLTLLTQHRFPFYLGLAALCGRSRKWQALFAPSERVLSAVGHR